VPSIHIVVFITSSYHEEIRVCILCWWMSCLAEWHLAYLCLCLFYPLTRIASVWGFRFSQLWRFRL